MSLLAAAIALSSAGQQPERAPLVPSAKWTLDYAAAQCTLSRSFGTGADQLVLGIRTSPGNWLVTLIVVQPGRARSGSGAATFTLRTPSRLKIEGRYPSARPTREGGSGYETSVWRTEFDKLRTAPQVELTLDGEQKTLALSGFETALDALKKCEADLVKQWGLDPQLITRAKTPVAPLGAPQAWVTDNDYPASALSRREQGMVSFRLDIDAAGKPQGCTVVESTGFGELDAATCRNLVRRARFDPARDDAGVAIPSIFVSRFTWRIPR